MIDSHHQVDPDWDRSFYNIASTDQRGHGQDSRIRHLYCTILLQAIYDFCASNVTGKREMDRREARQWLLFDKRLLTEPEVYNRLEIRLIGQTVKANPKGLDGVVLTREFLYTMPKVQWWDIVVSCTDTMMTINRLRSELDRGRFFDYCDYIGLDPDVIREVLLEADKNPEAMERLRKDTSIYLTLDKITEKSKQTSKRWALGLMKHTRRTTGSVIDEMDA